MKKIKSSLFQRAPKLISSAIKMGQLKDIESVVNNLSELKGMPQKIGQIISMDFSEYIPEEYREKFSTLQGQSLELDANKILDIIQKDLGKEKFSHIKDFNPKPLGSGSIGQVHFAMIKKKPVVFKVRYPEIEKTINSDLALMLPIAKAYELFRPKSKDLSILMNEAKIMLLQEMDYLAEASNIMHFKEALKEDKRFSIPAVVNDYSSKNIICMEFIEGVSLKSFIQNEHDLDLKIEVAQSMLELFIEEFFKLGAVQTDPNFANYLIKNDGTIALLDFGATKKFSKDFRQTYFELLTAAYIKNEHDILFYGEKLGLVNRHDNVEALELFKFFMIDIMSFFRLENNPMNFSNEAITKRLMKNGWDLWKKQKISTPNSNLVFLHRKLGGLFALLKESKITLDLHLTWKKIELYGNELNNNKV